MPQELIDIMTEEPNETLVDGEGEPAFHDTDKYFVDKF
jgi:hypothetical protein